MTTTPPTRPSFRTLPTSWKITATTPGFSSHVVAGTVERRGYKYTALNHAGVWLRDCDTKGAAVSAIRRAWLRSHA